MANVKMNDVGTKKAMVVYALANGKCLNCSRALAFNEFQLDHITAQQTSIENGEAIDNSLPNLACLCNTCNASKQKQGIEFYSKDVQKFFGKVFAWVNKAQNPNDLRHILKNDFVAFDKTKVTKAKVDSLCDAYAMANPKSKFARIHKQGIYHKLS